MATAGGADVEAAKRTLRAAVSSRRAAFAASSGPAAALALRDRFLAGPGGEGALAPGTIVSGFWPLPSEIDPRPVLYHLHARGHPVALPVVTGRGRPLTFRHWRPGLELIPGSFGVLHPGPEAPEALPRLLIVPLLAFDRRGYRLGYGGGFYDRTLTGLRRTGRTVAVGVAFAMQEVEATPRDETDEPLDWVVTEREAIRLAAG